MIVTEFELIEAFSFTQAALREGAMDITTAFFAYVVCAYLAGAKLTRMVACSVSIIYSLFLLGPLIGVASATSIGISIMDKYVSSFPGGVYFTETVDVRLGLLLTLSPLLLAWTGSLMFMHLNIRKQA